MVYHNNLLNSGRSTAAHFCGNASYFATKVHLRCPTVSMSLALNNMKIRNAANSDLSAIYDLICNLEQSTFPKSNFEEIFDLNNSNNNIGYFVAHTDGRVVAFGSVYINELLHHCGKVGEIQELVVSPENRGKKVGSSLINEMIRWAQKQGATQVEVTCNLARKDAHEFYQSLGFVHTHKKFVFNYE